MRRCCDPPLEKNKISWPQAIKKDRSRVRWASLVEGSVLLVSACKVAVLNVEGSGLTEWLGVSVGGGNTVNDPGRKNALAASF